MGTADSGTSPDAATPPPDIEALIPMVRRIVAARVADEATVDDLVQETLVRVLAATGRVAAPMIEPYTIVTARNVVSSLWRDQNRDRRNRHRVLDLDRGEAPDEGLVTYEERVAMAAALDRLPERERQALLEHEVSGRDTRSLAEEQGSTAGAVAAALHRARARLRVEYLLALDRGEPPTERCRAVLLALSGGERRRQREAGADHHLLECNFCARLGQPLLDRGQPRDDQVRIPIRSDADIVTARQASREMAARLTSSRTNLTLVATAVSEVTRNIVRFAGSGQLVVELIDEPRPGIRITAQDAGPGIPDVEQAMADGYSTYNGLGLGLPGARRLMDEFAVVSQVGHGTTVTMTKWLGER